MLTVTVGAYPASHHRLCLVVRHVEPEFAPDLREDDVCCTVVQPCIREKIIQRLNASGASAKIRLSIYNTDGRPRIEYHLIAFSLRGNLDQ